MPNETDSSSETSIKARIAKMETDIKLLAKGLKRASVEIENEWGEELLEPGTEIAGVKF